MIMKLLMSVWLGTYKVNKWLDLFLLLIICVITNLFMQHLGTVMFWLLLAGWVYNNYFKKEKVKGKKK